MGQFSVDDLAPGDRAVSDAFKEYNAIARAVPWAAVFDRLSHYRDPTRQAPSTLLRHQVGTEADRRCQYVRVVSVPRSSQAPLRVMLARPQLAAVALRALPVTTEPWAVPAGCHLCGPDAVPPSVEKAAASAAYRSQKRRHGDMARGCPARSGPQVFGSQAVASPGAAVGVFAVTASGALACHPGSREPEEDEEKASAGDPGGPAVVIRGSAASTLAKSAEYGPRTPPREEGASVAHADRWASSWRDDQSGAAGDGLGGGWAP